MVLKSFVILAINATVYKKLTLLSPFLFFFNLFITPSKKRERTVQKVIVCDSPSKSTTIEENPQLKFNYIRSANPIECPVTF